MRAKVRSIYDITVYQHVDGPVVEVQFANERDLHLQLNPAQAESLLKQLLAAMAAQPNTLELAQGFYSLRSFRVVGAGLDKIGLAMEFPAFTRINTVSVDQAQTIAASLQAQVAQRRGPPPVLVLESHRPLPTAVE